MGESSRQIGSIPWASHHRSESVLVDNRLTSYFGGSIMQVPSLAKIDFSQLLNELDDE